MADDKLKKIFNPLSGQFDTVQDVTDLITYSEVATDYQAVSEKGQANGYTPLDNGGKVPIENLPNSVMQYKDQWNAATNTPTLVDGTGNAGDVYEVSVAGTQNLGSGNITFNVGDWVVYSDVSNMWKKSINSNEVVSVNGLTGAVNLDTDDVPEGTTNKYFTSAGFDTEFATKTTDDLLEGVVNLYYTDTRVQTIAANKTLSNLTSPTAINQDLIFAKSISLVKTADATAANSETLSVLTGSTITSGSSGNLALSSGTSVGASGTVQLTSGNTTSSIATGAITVRSGNATTGNASSGAVTISTGVSAGTSPTGNLTLSTGISPGLAGSGDIALNSGNVTTSTSGSSGAVTIASGTSVAGASGATGAVSLASGNHASAAVSAGIVTVKTGNQTGAAFSGTGAATTVTTGNVTSATATGISGATNILSGNAAGAADTGNVVVRSGNATGTGDSGAVILQTGSVTTGARGTVNIVDSSLATATIGAVWKLQNITTGAGRWQNPINLRRIATSAQVLVPNANTVEFPTADYDTNSIYSANTTSTIPVDGKYRIYARITVTASSTGTSTNYIQIKVNGVDVSEATYANAYTTGVDYTFIIEDTLDLNLNDTVTITFFNGFGANANKVTTSYGNAFTLNKID